MTKVYSINKAETINLMHSNNIYPAIEFHLHDGCEIYFLLSDRLNYFIEKKVYPIKAGDIIITNSYEIHKPSYQPDILYERMIIQFDPAVIQPHNTADFDLLNCFLNRPKGEQNKISLNKGQMEEALRHFNKIKSAQKNLSRGDNILKFVHFIELLVFINRLFANTEPADEHPNVPDKLADILEHIDNNLENDLSLEALEQKFYINRFYLSRLFKKGIDINIHDYIVYKRISKAKELLADGYSVTEACQSTGFNDYSNFIRTFKKTVGLPPGQYKKGRGDN